VRLAIMMRGINANVLIQEQVRTVVAKFDVEWEA
jgi:hypothetical protein